MRVCDNVADFYVAATTVERGVEDPRMAVEGVRDRGGHGDAGCGANTANVRVEDVCEERYFAN